MVENPQVGLTVWYINRGYYGSKGYYEILQGTIHSECAFGYRIADRPDAHICPSRTESEMWASREDAVVGCKAMLRAAITKLTGELSDVFAALSTIGGETTAGS